MRRWPEVAIGEVAQPVNRPHQPVPGVTYRQIGVRLWGEGAYERESIDGAETKYKTLNRVAAGDIIVNKIWARNGSVSVVSEDLDGCFCSGEFPLFRPDAAKLDASWFFWITQTRWFWDRCDQQSRGTSGKNRLRPQKFLEIPIPLAPIEEQRRVVRRIEQLAAAAAKVAGLQIHADQASVALFGSLTNRLFVHLARRSAVNSLRDVGAYVTSGPRNWSQYYADTGDRFYRAQDIGKDGRTNDAAKQHLVPPRGAEGRHARVAPGDVLVVITGATVGRVALVLPTHEPGFVSQHVALCRVPSSVLAPEYLATALMSPSGQEQLLASRYGQGKPGLNLDNVLDLQIAVPSLALQREVVAEQVALRERREYREARRQLAKAAVNALLPSALSSAFGTAN